MRLNLSGPTWLIRIFSLWIVNCFKSLESFESCEILGAMSFEGYEGVRIVLVRGILTFAIYRNLNNIICFKRKLCTWILKVWVRGDNTEVASKLTEQGNSIFP